MNRQWSARAGLYRPARATCSEAVGDRGTSLDYVVFGIGFGATLLVLGLLIRDLGPRLRFRNPSDPDGVFHAEELVARVSWSRFCSALGAVWAIAGLAFVVITAVCMMLMVSDGTVGQVMIASLLVLLVTMALWTWAYFNRFGSYGILPERDEVAEPAVVTVRPEPRRPAIVKENSGERVVAAPDDPEPAEREAPRDEPETRVDESETDIVAERESSPPDQASSDEALDRSGPLQTPEERMASATTPLNHESLEAELDMPVQANRRPRQRSFRPSDAAGANAINSDADKQDTHESNTESTEDAESPGPDISERAAPQPRSTPGTAGKSASHED